MNIAIIPARGGSKRIPRKNIKEFCGKPMIAWSIEAANSSKLFDYIIVSTDDLEIAEIAKRNGAEIPFIRPAKISDDYTGTGEVVKHAVNWVIKNIGKPKYVCTIYATAPFIKTINIKKGYQLLLNNNCETVFTVTSFPFPIQRAIKITKQNRVKMFQPKKFMIRSQDLETAYHDAGQFYWSKISAIVNDKTTFSNISIPLILPRHQVQDIDTNEDWYRAELMFLAQKSIKMRDN